MHRSIGWTRLAVLAAAGALAFVAPGCGDSDDDNGDSAGGSAAAETSNGGANGDGGGASSGSSASTSGHTGQEAEIDEVLLGIQDDFDQIDGASYCSRLTEAGVRQVEKFGKAYGHGNDCAKIIDTVAKNTRDAGVEQRPSRLISVKFKGDRAVATIRNGKRPPEPMIFVKEDGEWKIPDPGFQTGSSGESRELAADPAERFKQILRAREELERRNQGQ